MKILMLCDRLALGGAETHIYELCRALMASGHTVLAASAGGPYAEKLIALGVRHTTLPMAELSPASLLRARRGLSRLLMRERPDIVHAHARVPARLAKGPCRRLHIPLITTAHWVFRADGWRRYLSAWGDMTLAVSEDIRSYLLKEYRLSPSNVRLTRNGIDTRTFRPRGKKEDGFLTGGGRIIHVSRLDRGRSGAAEALLAAAPALCESGLCRTLTIVGGGDCEGALRARAEEINRALGRPFVRMLGRRSEIAPLLSEGDVFVGVSRAALEAMASGLPVVLAGDEGYSGILTEAKMAAAASGNFCARGAPPLESEALSRDILTLLRDEALCRALGEAGRRFVLGSHGTARMAQDALFTYRTAKARFEGTRTHAAHARGTKPSFLLSGYYGADNLGDDAILAYLVARLREEGVAHIAVLSRTPKKTAAQFGVRAVARSSPIKVYRAMRRADCFLLGGGNLLQNETSDRSLFYYTQLLALARQAGCKSILYGGIGALNEAGRERVRRALPFLDGALLRTPADINKLRALGGRMPSRLLPDGALYLQDMPRRASGAGAPILLIALCGRDEDAAGAAAALALCRHAKKTHGAQILLVGMHKGQDTETLSHFAATLGDGEILDVESGEELIAALSTVSLVFSTRLHPLILAAVAGTPAIAWGESEKIADFTAYAHACQEGAGCKQDMLFHARTEQQSTAMYAFADACLCEKVDEQKALAYLQELRAGEEDFSFLDFCEKL